MELMQQKSTINLKENQILIGLYSLLHLLLLVHI